MPVYYWHRLHDSGNVGYLFKKVNLKPGKYLKALDVIGRELMDEYVARFGFTEDFLSVCRKKRELVKLYQKRITTGDTYWQTFIDICEHELEVMQQPRKTDFYEFKAQVEQRLGRSVDEMTTSVAQFYSYVKMVSRG